MPCMVSPLIRTTALDMSPGAVTGTASEEEFVDAGDEDDEGEEDEDEK